MNVATDIKLSLQWSVAFTKYTNYSDVLEVGQRNNYFSNLRKIIR